MKNPLQSWFDELQWWFGIGDPPPHGVLQEKYDECLRRLVCLQRITLIYERGFVRLGVMSEDEIGTAIDISEEE